MSNGFSIVTSSEKLLHASNVGDDVATSTLRGPRMGAVSGTRCGAVSPLSTGSGGEYICGNALPQVEIRHQIALLLSFTFSASTYTCSPICLNFSLICAIPAFATASSGKPSAITPATVIPTEFGSFSVAA